MFTAMRHPYLPGECGTQCHVFGCWGWADDPRHTNEHMPAPRMETVRRRIIRHETAYRRTRGPALRGRN